MKEKLYDCINLASYFIWEYGQSENALGLWCCAEDIANYFEQKNILSEEKLCEIIALGKGNEKYISFLKDISYKIYSYSGNIDHIKNWFLAERLIQNGEWREAVIEAANIYRNMKGDDGIIKTIRSDLVRKYYKQIH